MTGRADRLRRAVRWWPAILPVAFLAAFFLYPLLAILGVGFLPEGRLDLSSFGEILTRASLREAAWFTLWQAVASTVLTLVAAMPGAYLFARFDFPGKSLLRAAVTIPFVLPTVVVGSAFLALLGPEGPFPVDLRRTVPAILIAHVFYNYAVVVRTVGGLWSHLDPRVEEAARMLGAGRRRTFRDVTLPLLAPAIAAASSIVFLFSFTSFGVVLILGGLSLTTIEVEIWRQTTSFLDLSLAGALAVVQLVAVTTILAAYARYQERRSLELNLLPRRHAARRPRTPGERGFVAANLLFMAVLLGGPLAYLVWRSIRPGEVVGLEAYRALFSNEGAALFVPAATAVRNSLVFAVVATTIAVVIGMLSAAVIAYRRGRLSRSFDVLLMLPLGTSAVTIGFGFLVALDWPVDLRTSPVLIPLAHALVAMPFVVRTAVPVMRSVRARLREAAAVLGAPPAQVWRRIDLPIVTRALLVGAGFAFAISLGEFGATAFIARPDAPTLPVAIYRLLSRPGVLTFGQAMAASTVLMGLVAASILAIERLRGGEAGEF